MEVPAVTRIKAQNVLPSPAPIDELPRLQGAIRPGLRGQRIPPTLEEHVGLLSQMFDLLHFPSSQSRTGSDLYMLRSYPQADTPG